MHKHHILNGVSHDKIEMKIFLWLRWRRHSELRRICQLQANKMQNKNQNIVTRHTRKPEQ